MRYLLEVAYNGTNYHGWQIQENAITIQQVLNQAIEKLLSEDKETQGCGRTDTGVHAVQQFVHFDTNNTLSTYVHGHALNKLLPHDISVRNIFQVERDFHARFNATHRAYRYRIISRKDPFRHMQAAIYPYQLDIDKMNQAAQYLFEFSDFSSFAKVSSAEGNYNCKILEAKWSWVGDEFQFHIKSNRFLRGMVRAIVGTMLDIGSGKMEPENIKAIIESKDRTLAGSSALACGLYLESVQYPEGALVLV